MFLCRRSVSTAHTVVNGEAKAKKNHSKHFCVQIYKIESIALFRFSFLSYKMTKEQSNHIQILLRDCASIWRQWQLIRSLSSLQSVHTWVYDEKTSNLHKEYEEIL